MNGIVKIHGKEYKTVALRVSEFRESEQFKGWAIETDIITNADLVIIKAFIKNEEGVIKATGYAEEVRGSTNINKTSALENCETSAIGRALSNIGLGGQEYASANEVTNAIVQQAEQKGSEQLINYNNTVRDLWASIAAIKHGIATVDVKNGIVIVQDTEGLSVAAEAYQELTEEEKIALWLAPSKGGIFTTKEREVMKSAEFREAAFNQEGEKGGL